MNENTPNPLKAVLYLKRGMWSLADDYYNLSLEKQFEHDSKHIVYMLTMFSILMDSEDARMRLMNIKKMVPLSAKARAFNKWWMYPAIFVADVKAIVTNDILALDIAKYKYQTPFIEDKP